MIIAAAVGRWACEHDTLQALIPPGLFRLGGFVESLHNRMRDDLLEDNMFNGACSIVCVSVFLFERIDA